MSDEKIIPMADYPKNEPDMDFGSLLDLLGTIGGFQDEETFKAEKEEILNSGITMQDFLSILGGDMAEKFNGLREFVKLPIQKLTDTAKIPTYAHITDACADMYADETITIQPGATAMISTGLAMAIPEGYVVHIYPRSSIGVKTPLRLPNSVGVIDTGYRNEVKMIYTNTGSEPYTINQGDRIAQMCIDHSPMIDFQIVEDVKSIGEDRGGGFGSSGN